MSLTAAGAASGYSGAGLKGGGLSSPGRPPVSRAPSGPCRSLRDRILSRIKGRGNAQNFQIDCIRRGERGGADYCDLIRSHHRRFYGGSQSNVSRDAAALMAGLFRDPVTLSRQRDLTRRVLNVLKGAGPLCGFVVLRDARREGDRADLRRFCVILPDRSSAVREDNPLLCSRVERYIDALNSGGVGYPAGSSNDGDMVAVKRADMERNIRDLEALSSSCALFSTSKDFRKLVKTVSDVREVMGELSNRPCKGDEKSEQGRFLNALRVQAEQGTTVEYQLNRIVKSSSSLSAPVSPSFDCSLIGRYLLHVASSLELYWGSQRRVRVTVSRDQTITISRQKMSQVGLSAALSTFVPAISLLVLFVAVHTSPIISVLLGMLCVGVALGVKFRLRNVKEWSFTFNREDILSGLVGAIPEEKLEESDRAWVSSLIPVGETDLVQCLPRLRKVTQTRERWHALGGEFEPSSSLLFSLRDLLGAFLPGKLLNALAEVKIVRLFSNATPEAYLTAGLFSVQPNWTKKKRASDERFLDERGDLINRRANQRDCVLSLDLEVLHPGFFFTTGDLFWKQGMSFGRGFTPWAQSNHRLRDSARADVTYHRYDRVRGEFCQKVLRKERLVRGGGMSGEFAKELFKSASLSDEQIGLIQECDRRLRSLAGTGGVRGTWSKQEEDGTVVLVYRSGSTSYKLENESRLSEGTSVWVYGRYQDGERYVEENSELLKIEVITRKDRRRSELKVTAPPWIRAKLGLEESVYSSPPSVVSPLLKQIEEIEQV